MYACGRNSEPTPVAVTNTAMTRLDLFHTRWNTITTLSDADAITSITIVHLDCLLTGITEVSASLIILRDGDAKQYPILDGVLPLGYRVNPLLLPLTRKPADPSAEETSASPSEPLNWDKVWEMVNALAKGIPSLVKQRFSAN